MACGVLLVCFARHSLSRISGLGNSVSKVQELAPQKAVRSSSRTTSTFGGHHTGLGRHIGGDSVCRAYTRGWGGACPSLPRHEGKGRVRIRVCHVARGHAGRADREYIRAELDDNRGGLGSMSPPHWGFAERVVDAACILRCSPETSRESRLDRSRNTALRSLQKHEACLKTADAHTSCNHRQETQWTEYGIEDGRVCGTAFDQARGRRSR
jgi:hypothetical protein